LVGLGDAIAFRAEAFGELHDVGVCERYVMVFAQLEVHLPFDQPVAAVLPDEDHQRYLLADRSLDFL